MLRTRFLIITMLCASIGAYSQTVKLSFKVILDSLDQAPVYLDEQWIDDHVDYANEILSKYDRGIHFEREPTLFIGGTNDLELTSLWNRQTSNIGNRDALESAAIANPSRYMWRETFINIYVNEAGGGAICSFPGSGEVILITGDRPNSTLLHEIGHFFDLCHTHGCSCSGTPICDCGSNMPGQDNISNTLPDIDCWDRDSIALFSYSKLFNNCNSTEQRFVDTTFFNIMSYHRDEIINLSLGSDRSVLAYEQVEVWVQSIFENQDREDVVDGLPIYVDDDATCFGFFTCPIGCLGSPELEYESFLCGYGEVESDRTLIVLRDGVYDEVTGGSLLLDQDCLLVSDGLGSAIIK